MINLILFGPPGSGKGTQAARLVEKYKLMHVSTGDLFRYEMGNDTPLGLKAKEYISKGELVPDEVTVGMLSNKLDMYPEAKGFILDGFPRNVFQSEALDKLLSDKNSAVTQLIALDVEEEEIVQRILKRAETSGRKDDADEGIIRNRIEVYKNETAIVFDYYEKANKAKRISGMGSIDEITNRLFEEIDSIL